MTITDRGSAQASVAESSVALPPHQGVPMPEYRIFPLTSDNHIKSAPALIVCENDSMAMKQAQKMLDGHDLEVWEGTRRVTRLNSTEAP
jgi:hypothetical protein